MFYTENMDSGQNDEICFTSMGAIFKHDRSKLKLECIDVKSGCVTSVGPILSPHSLSKQKSRATVPLRHTVDSIFILFD